jgi:hypothetical protein
LDLNQPGLGQHTQVFQNALAGNGKIMHKLSSCPGAALRQDSQQLAPG